MAATSGVTAFNSNGFSIDNVNAVDNVNTATYASWTFRESPAFFDVVTYTGNGANRTIAHNLGVVPGMIIIKKTNDTAAWQVYHRSLANTEYAVLNTTAAKATGATRWNSTTPTASVFSLGTDTSVNNNGDSYVAYVFAHDASTNGVIQCGGYTGNSAGTSSQDINLGWEAQWLLVKEVGGTGNWWLYDALRGMPEDSLGTGGSMYLAAQSSGAEAGSTGPYPNATGFGTSPSSNFNLSDHSYIYLAIRKAPMATPTSGAQVFNAISGRVGTDTTAAISGIGFSPDLVIPSSQTNGSAHPFIDRLRGVTEMLFPPYTNAVQTNTDVTISFDMDGITVGADATLQVINRYYDANRRYMAWFLRRAPGVFDIAAFNGSASDFSVNHSLGVAPELIILKRRGVSTGAWFTFSSYYSGGFGSANNNYFIRLNTTEALAGPGSFFTATPTSTALPMTGGVNYAAGDTGVAYLFATLAGVSKVGSYTGTGAQQTINAGFTAGSRFILIKRTDSTGDWYLWDSVRGIVSGNDPYILLNATDAEVTTTDYIDPDNSGFVLSSTAPAALNASGGTYLYVAFGE